MWILIAALPIGMFLGLVAGGSFNNLHHFRLRVWYLLIPAFAIAALMAFDRNPPGEWILLPVALVLFAIVAFRNIAVVGMTVVGVGVIANLVPVLINGDMPVREEAVIQAGLADQSNTDLVKLGAGRRFEEPGDYLVVLGAIVPVEPVKEVLTFGDLIVVAGLLNVGFRVIKPPKGHREDGAESPAVTLAEALGIDPIAPLSGDSEPVGPAPVAAPPAVGAVEVASANVLDLTESAHAAEERSNLADDLFLDDLPDVVQGSATWGD